MNYFRYIFSDKKARVFWIVYYAIFGCSALTILFLAILLPDSSIDLLSIIIYFLVGFAFILFYSRSYINYKARELFIEKYSERFEKNSLKNKTVELIQGSYHVTAIKSNYYAKINPEPKIEEFLIARMEDYLIIFGQTYTFGVFREHLSQ